MLTVGTLLIAFEVHVFEIPNGFTIGGVSGMGIALAKATGTDTSTLISALNILLLIIGFIFLGRSCGIRTVYCSLVFSASLQVAGIVCPVKQPLTDEPLLELCCLIILTAIGSGMIFHCDATSGGTDIIAMIMRKYTPLDVGKALLCVDFLVAVTAFFAFGVKTGIISVVGVFIRGFLIDEVVESFGSCKFFTIITEKPDEIKHFILNDLSRGATIVQAKGAYTDSDKAMLYTVCRRFEALRLRKKIHTIDPDAFIIITTSSEILGSGFSRFQ